MKVSRKVRRRSRKHTSSVSRRRLRFKNKNKKNSYRKKYTQRGGARSRKHKHGRRFHRGGGGEVNNIFKCPEPNSWLLSTTEDPTIKLGTSQANVSDVTLFYKKEGSFTFKPVSESFTITLIVFNSPVCEPAISKYPPPLFKVLFKRITKSKDDNRDVTFSITNLQDFTDKQALQQLARIENSSDVYDFSSPDNEQSFKAIQICVKQKLKEVYSKLKRLLELCDSHVFQRHEGNKNEITCDVDPNVTDVEDVKKFLDSMFIGGDQQNITNNVSRLKRLASIIVILLDDNTDTDTDSAYYRNLDVALTEFGSVYRRIIFDTHEGDYAVQGLEINR